MSESDEVFMQFVSDVVQGPFTTYCEYSIRRPELIPIAREGLIVKIDVLQRKILLHSILFNVSTETEKVLAEILPGYPLGGILKLTLLFHDVKSKLYDQIQNSTVWRNSRNTVNTWDVEKLISSADRGEIKLNDFFRMMARLVQEKKIDLATYNESTHRILQATGHRPSGSLEKYSCTSLTIANTSAYFIHSMISNVDKRINILYRVHDSCQLLSAFWRNESSLVVDMKEYHDIQPVASLNNIFWTMNCKGIDFQSGISEQGCKIVKMEDPLDSYLVIIHSRQKTKTSTFEIDRVLQVDARQLSANPHSTQISIVANGHFFGREEASEDMSFCGDDAMTELCQSDTHNNSPNASGQDESHNIIPDFSWKSGTYLLNMICTEHYSLLLSIVNLSESFIADQRVTGVKLQPSCVFLYGLHGLCAVHQLNKCCPHSHQTTLLVPDTTLSNKTHPQLNEHRFHSHSSIVTTMDASEDGLLCVSGDNQGKICIWAAYEQSSIKFNHSKTFEEFQFPSFQLVNWYNDHRHQQYDPYYHDAGVRSLKLSPSQDSIVAGIGNQLLLLRRQHQAMVSTNNDQPSSPLYVSAILDLQEQSIASYEVVFDHQCMLTIWRFSSSVHAVKDETDNFSTLTVWKHIDPSLNLLYTIDNQSAEQFHQNQDKDESKEHCHPNCISGFVEIGGEFIPLTDVMHISIHPCAQLLVARFQSDCISHGKNNNSSNLREYEFLHILTELFATKQHVWTQWIELFAILAAAFQPATIALLSTALDISREDIEAIFEKHLSPLLSIEQTPDRKEIINVAVEYTGILKWMTSTHPHRISGHQPHCFWIDISIGHNLLCAMYLKYCGNKSIAVEHPWQTYLQTYGPYHLRRSSRGLRTLTASIRKIDETANIKHFLPYQIGYISGLQEIYARRVGLSGTIPKEIGELCELRVLSMGNNRLTGHLPESLGQLSNLQRIVLHQNNLIGEVPQVLGEMGCIVNLAGNPRLEYGEDVTAPEREALIELFYVTKGHRWTNRTNWTTRTPVCKWYKVGVLSSHVHSLVMSSNNMDGILPPGIKRLHHLRMIELATMPHLVGPLPKELCQIVTLRRLCICRCGLSGSLPDEIGMLIHLEELQLFGNRLTGKIPASIGNLINLKLLSLGEYTGGNDFQPATFPSCIEQLVNLEALFLADCKLKGPLPSWIGNLRELRQLDLQRNQLKGPLPASIGRLSNLLYLNIKDNPHLGGHLPIQELAHLTRLNRLSLVHCGFEDRETAMNTLRMALPRCKIWI